MDKFFEIISKLPWRFVVPRPGYFLAIEEAKLTRGNAEIINEEAFSFAIKLAALCIFALMLLVLIPVILALGLVLIGVSSLVSGRRPRGVRSSRNP